MFHGRIDRIGFLLGSLFIFLTLVFVAILTGVIVASLKGASAPNAATGISGTFFLAITIVCSFLYVAGSIGLAIRRLHDMNLSGWWVLLYFVPIVGNIAPWVLLFIRGTDGPNKYGERLSPRDFDRVLFGPRPKDSMVPPAPAPDLPPNENRPL